MSCNYADSLSHYEHKGKLGLPEKFDGEDTINKNVKLLCKWLRDSKHTVVHTGAGISTSAGIPDFRGPNGVWTLEKQGKKPSINVSWDDAKPTFTHMALLALQRAGFVSYIVTQNIDGLHLRSGIQRRNIAELHGNLFVDKCSTCQRQFVRPTAAETVAQKTQGRSCLGYRNNGRLCRGKLHDTILDWEDSLPDFDLELSHMNSCIADLSLCLGTTLQIIPSGNLPVHTRKRGGKLVICNLQPTKQDRHADLLIHTYVDDILKKVLNQLQIPPLSYDPSIDPVIITRNLLSNLDYDYKSTQWPSDFEAIEWTVPEQWVKDKQLVDKVKNRKIVKRKNDLNNDLEITKKKIKPDNDINGKSEKEIVVNGCDETIVKREEKVQTSDLIPEKKESTNKKLKIENDKIGTLKIEN